MRVSRSRYISGQPIYQSFHHLIPANQCVTCPRHVDFSPVAEKSAYRCITGLEEVFIGYVILLSDLILLIGQRAQRNVTAIAADLTFKRLEVGVIVENVEAPEEPASQGRWRGLSR